MCVFCVTVAKISMLAKSSAGLLFITFGDAFWRYLGALGAHLGCLGELLAPLVEGRIWGRILGCILRGQESQVSWPVRVTRRSWALLRTLDTNELSTLGTNIGNSRTPV